MFDHHFRLALVAHVRRGVLRRAGFVQGMRSHVTLLCNAPEMQCRASAKLGVETRRAEGVQIALLRAVAGGGLVGGLVVTPQVAKRRLAL